MILLGFTIAMLMCATIPAVIYLRNAGAYRPAPRHVSHRPRVSVLIPARNEENSISLAVQSALSNRNVDVEVLVMDDQSTDNTARIVRNLAVRDDRVHLLHAPPLPPGWNGKQHACAHLAAAASHPWLVFVDADVRLMPDALARMVAFMEESDADLGSGIPRQITGTFWERLVIPQIHFLLLGFLPIRRSRKRSHPSYGAGCGQLFIARAEAYRRAGGHAVICQSRHDGIKLPRAFRAAGLRTDLFDATDVATCRMYENAGQVWRGFMKNATEGMGAPSVIVPFSTLLIFGQVLPVVFAMTTNGPAKWLAATAAALGWGVRLMMARRYRQSWLGAVLHPLGVLSVLTIQWTALVREVLGMRVAWKGRTESAPETGQVAPVRAGTLLLACALAASVAEAGTNELRVASFKLRDQYGAEHHIEFPREKICYLTVADRKGSKELDAWIEPVAKQYGDRVDVIGVADVSGVPRPLQGMVRDHFKKSVAHPVMLDWTGEVVRGVGMLARNANVYVVSPDGAVALHQSGPADKEKLQRVMNTLSEKLEASGSEGSTTQTKQKEKRVDDGQE
jgi:hypothetical protein